MNERLEATSSSGMTPGWISGWAGLAFWLLASAITAAFGGLFGPGEWYYQLAKPEWTPPGWIFGPVWTFLYASMAVAAWLAGRSGGWRANRRALTIYLVHLAVNAAWSWIFFGQRQIGWALVDIIILLLLIIVVTFLFWKRNRAAGILMLPYILWVAFATTLNYRLWVMN